MFQEVFNHTHESKEITEQLLTVTQGSMNATKYAWNSILSL